MFKKVQFFKVLLLGFFLLIFAPFFSFDSSAADLPQDAILISSSGFDFFNAGTSSVSNSSKGVSIYYAGPDASGYRFELTPESGSFPSDFYVGWNTYVQGVVNFNVYVESSSASLWTGNYIRRVYNSEGSLIWEQNVGILFIPTKYDVSVAAAYRPSGNASDFSPFYDLASGFSFVWDVPSFDFNFSRDLLSVDDNMIFSAYFSFNTHLDSILYEVCDFEGNIIYPSRSFDFSSDRLKVSLLSNSDCYINFYSEDGFYLESSCVPTSFNNSLVFPTFLDETISRPGTDDVYISRPGSGFYNYYNFPTGVNKRPTINYYRSSISHDSDLEPFLPFSSGGGHQIDYPYSSGGHRVGSSGYFVDKDVTVGGHSSSMHFYAPYYYCGAEYFDNSSSSVRPGISGYQLIYFLHDSSDEIVNSLSDSFSSFSGGLPLPSTLPGQPLTPDPVPDPGSSPDPDPDNPDPDVPDPDIPDHPDPDPDNPDFDWGSILDWLKNLLRWIWSFIWGFLSKFVELIKMFLSLLPVSESSINFLTGCIIASFLIFLIKLFISLL